MINTLQSTIDEARFNHVTADQYEIMLNSGAIQEGAPIELIDGLLVRKDRAALGESIMTIGTKHGQVIDLLILVAALLRNRNCFLRLQCSIRVSDNSVPEPDGCIVRGKAREYQAIPTAKDVSCVIEASDRSLPSDRTSKLKLYASVGIPQYIIVNLQNMVIEVYENPLKNSGTYSVKEELAASGTINFLLPDGSRLPVPATEILPNA